MERTKLIPDAVGGTSGSMPDVFEFRDYRAFLAACCKYLKAHSRAFTHRMFAAKAGFGSQSYLRMVMNGERDISQEAIQKFANALKLRKKQTRYFAAMVLYNQAHTEYDKSRYMEEMIAHLPDRNVTGLDKQKLEYLASNLFVTIREMTALPDFQEDIEWIRAGLRCNVKPGDVRHALAVLERLGLVVRGKDGKLRHSRRSLKTEPGMRDIEILNYHRQVLLESRDAIMTAPYDEWDIAAKTIPITKEALPRVQAILHDSLDKITRLVNEGSDRYHEVYQVNMQMFPLTMTKRPREFGYVKDSGTKKSKDKS